MVDPKKIYEQCYRLLDNKTPLKIDCGQLCGGICCEDGELEDAGMYLFPFEEGMYQDQPDWLRVEDSDFCYGAADKPAPIAICEGRCQRKLRPLACRIFPLAPYLDGHGKLSIVIDPRAKAICPLAKCYGAEELEPEFVRRTAYIFAFLIREKHVYDFIEALSELMDEYSEFGA